MSSCPVVLIVSDDHPVKRLTIILNRLDVKYCLFLPNETPNFTPTHVILVGGNIVPQWAIDSNARVLGLGSGMLSIARISRGLIRKVNHQVGQLDVTEIINGYQFTKTRWIDRDEIVMRLPGIFKVIGVSSQDDIISFTDGKKWWGVQYHAEISKYGDTQVFRQFLFY
jgi:GMP synthase-like glutamine amidotransferase